MSFEMISENELRVKLAEWTLLHERCYSYYRSEELKENFIMNFKIPDTVFKHVISYITAEDVPVSIFKTAVHIDSFRTYSGSRQDFLYYRISEIIPVEGAKLPDLNHIGYIISPDCMEKL